MNRRQRIAAQLGGGLLLLGLLFPPRVVPYTGHTIWGFITSEPKEAVTEDTWSSSQQKNVHWEFEVETAGVNWGYLALEIAIIAVIAGLVLVSLKDKE